MLAALLIKDRLCEDVIEILCVRPFSKPSKSIDWSKRAGELRLKSPYKHLGHKSED